jgi:hypothetical protein
MNESSNYSLEENSTPEEASDKLVLPDWSGHVARVSRVPADEWLAYCRANLSRLRSRPGYAKRRRQNGITAEFSL